MFSLVKYNEITPCIRGSEHLTSILDRGGVSKLWLNSEHIFLCTNEGPNFYAFDVVPQLKWRRAVQSTLKDCVLDKISEPLVEVIWDSSNPSLVFIVTENGTTNIWEFLRPSHEWLKHKTIQLSNAKGSQIINVKYHEESNNLFWCEKRGFAIDAYCVCYRSVNVQDTNEKVKIGSTQAVLHNCPLVNVHVFNNGVFIQPRQVYLERILIFWTSGSVNLQAIVVNSGKVQESLKGLSDFRDITTSLVGSWIANNDSKTWLGITTHGSSGDLLLLNKNGAVTKLSINCNTANLRTVCNFKLPSNIHQNFEDLVVFSNQLIFGFLDSNSYIFIYDIISGKLLQILQEFNSGSVKVLPGTNCKHPITVFWNSRGIWKLNCKSLNELVKTVTTGNGNQNCENLDDEPNTEAYDDSEMTVGVQEVLPKDRMNLSAEVLELLDIVKWLYLFGLKHSAAVLLLEHVVSGRKRGESIPERTLQLLKRLEKEVLRNPGILLTIFQGDLRLKEECRSELKSFLDEIDQSTVPSEYMTPLNLKILPFLRELYERWNEQIVVPAVDLGQLSTVWEDSAFGVLDAAARAVVAGTTDALSLEKMGILSLHEPKEAVKAFVKDGRSLLMKTGDEMNNIVEVLRAELNDRRWKRRSSPENAAVIDVLFRLLYKEHPERLLDVLDLAEEIMGTSKDEGTSQDLQESIRDFMLDFLPNVWSEKECNLKRIKVHAQILDRLGLNREALAVFLQRQLWHDAVEFYVDVTGSSTDTLEVSQLYQILLSSLLRGSGTSQSKLLSRVFDMKPEVIESQNLFKLCLRNVSESSMQEVFKKDCLTVGEARKTILKYLPKS